MDLSEKIVEDIVKPNINEGIKEFLDSSRTHQALLVLEMKLDGYDMIVKPHDGKNDAGAVYLRNSVKSDLRDLRLEVTNAMKKDGIEDIDSLEPKTRKLYDVSIRRYDEIMK
jgi:hypothetical protein